MIDVRHAAEAAYPETPVLGVSHGKDIIGKQSVAHAAHGETLAVGVELGEAAAGAGPELAVRPFIEHEDVIGGETVLHGEITPGLTIESRETAAPGAAPHHAVVGDSERDDVIGVIRDVHTLKALLDLLLSVVRRGLTWVARELDVVAHLLERRAEPVGVLPVIPLAVFVAREAVLGREPLLAVLAFFERIYPRVGQTAVSVVDRIALPLGRVFQVATAHAIDTCPGSDPEITVTRLLRVIHELVREAVGDVEVAPLVGLGVANGEAAAVGADQNTLAEAAHVENTVGKQTRLVVEQLVLVRRDIVADHASGGADPHQTAIGEDALHITIAHAKMHEGTVCERHILDRGVIGRHHGARLELGRHRAAGRGRRRLTAAQRAQLIGHPEQTVAARQIEPFYPIETRHAVVGAEPHGPVRGLRHAEHDIPREAVVGGIAGPLVPVVAAHAAAPGPGPRLIIGGDGDTEHVVGIIAGLAVDQHIEVVTRPGAETGIEADGQIVGVVRAQPLFVGPAAPVLTVEHRDAALGAEPHALLRIDRHAVHPFVDQFFFIRSELARFVQAVRTGPGAYPHRAAGLFGEGVHPIVGEAVHGKERLPQTIAIPRHAAAVGAEPLPALAVDADGEDVFVGETFLAREGLLGIARGEVHLVHADRGPHPEAVGRTVYGERAHERLVAHTAGLHDTIRHRPRVSRFHRLTAAGFGGPTAAAEQGRQQSDRPTHTAHPNHRRVLK